MFLTVSFVLLVGVEYLTKIIFSRGNKVFGQTRTVLLRYVCMFVFFVIKFEELLNILKFLCEDYALCRSSY
jgi:hypothetical protein